MTSQHCIPIEPVAPSSTTRRRLASAAAELVVIASFSAKPAVREPSGERDEPVEAVHGGGDEDEAVEPIEQAAVPRDQAARILGARLAF